MSKGLIVLAASIVLVTAVYAATSSTNGARSAPLVSGTTAQITVNPSVTSVVQVPSVSSPQQGSVQVVQSTTDASKPITATTTPAVSTSSIPASSQTAITPSPIKAGQSYSMMQLLKLGYAVEAKGFAEGEAVPNAIAKSAAWKINGGTQDFWQGIVTSNGRFVLKQQLSGPKNSTVLGSGWTGGKQTSLSS